MLLTVLTNEEEDVTWKVSEQNGRPMMMRRRVIVWLDVFRFRLKNGLVRLHVWTRLSSLDSLDCKNQAVLSKEFE